MSTYLPDAKDPAEVMLIEFDFAGKIAAPTSPQVAISLRWGHGTHSTPLATSGSPTVSGTKVRQMVTAGVNLHDYNLRCLATDSTTSEVLAVDHILAVRTKPIA